MKTILIVIVGMCVLGFLMVSFNNWKGEYVQEQKAIAAHEYFEKGMHYMHGWHDYYDRGYPILSMTIWDYAENLHDSLLEATNSEITCDK